MKRENLLLIFFILLGAAGLTNAAEWLFINELTPIGKIVDVLEWISTLGDATPTTLLIGVLTFTLPILIISIARNYIRERWGI